MAEHPMQRSKQLAAMFLLGAVLVGGVLGFSADRLLARERLCPRWGDARAMRQRFLDDLELTAAQRTVVDSILDAKHRQMSVVLAPVRPQLDSISANARAQIARVLTPAQRVKFDALHREMKRRATEGDK
jgi:Spy/CpxP family protein refolding chaperone